MGYQKKEPEVIFEDEHLIVINKPAGMLSIPDRIQSEESLKDLLRSQHENIFTVHRLDKETSGVIVFAKNESMHKYLSQQFENRETQKFYKGFVVGTPEKPQGVIDLPVIEHPVKKGVMTTSAKGKPSVTEYEVAEAFRSYSLMNFKILTGRTHQIRVHMKSVGHPIACDELYGDGQPVLLSTLKKKFKLSKNEEEERPLLGRLALHAERLIFTHVDGQTMEFTAEMPKDMRALLQQLRKV